MAQLRVLTVLPRTLTGRLDMNCTMESGMAQWGNFVGSYLPKRGVMAARGRGG